jgi:lipopolysaccharide export system protein LptA
MSTLRVTYLKHQSSPNNTITLDSNNLITVTGNVSVTSNLTIGGAATITGNATVNLISDSKGELRNVPVNNQTGPYLLTLSDHGKMVAITTGNVFVPNAIFSAGDNITVYNNSASSITITQNTSVTMYLVGSASTGNRTLAQRGLATLLCVAANTFVVSGGGLT